MSSGPDMRDAALVAVDDLLRRLLDVGGVWRVSKPQDSLWLLTNASAMRSAAPTHLYVKVGPRDYKRSDNLRAWYPVTVATSWYQGEPDGGYAVSDIYVYATSRTHCDVDAHSVARSIVDMARGGLTDAGMDVLMKLPLPPGSDMHEFDVW